MPSIKLSADDQQSCLQVARESILYGLQHSSALTVNTQNHSADLKKQLASFVTLHKLGQLRGCIGALEAHLPLIKDVAEHAYAAAFQDSRFPPLRENEFDQLDIEISVLSTPETMSFDNEDDLLLQIQPDIDGLILQHGFNRGTFLPSVWQQLPDKKDFLNHLKMKAGLASDWWKDDVIVSRYETFSFS